MEHNHKARWKARINRWAQNQRARVGILMVNRTRTRYSRLVTGNGKATLQKCAVVTVNACVQEFDCLVSRCLEFGNRGPMESGVPGIQVEYLESRPAR